MPFKAWKSPHSSSNPFFPSRALKAEVIAVISAQVLPSKRWATMEAAAVLTAQPCNS